MISLQGFFVFVFCHSELVSESQGENLKQVQVDKTRLVFLFHFLNQRFQIHFHITKLKIYRFFDFARFMNF